jgi:cellulose synthase/poly-beta-1,6-N-acetylglucosamine synthase-like glycosyltransferase
MNLILLLIFIISIAYLLIISVFSIGWFSAGSYYRSSESPVTKASIIIPVRNESENIIGCLKDLIRQEYPVELYEIIISDDFSEDNTIELIENFIKTQNIQNIKLLKQNNLTLNTLHFTHNKGKKSALALAINDAKGELIITTDADCRMGSKWLASIADFYEAKKPRMIIGPVCYSNTPLSPLERGIRGMFKKFQSLEFLSLIGMTAGSAAISMPIMCNGANLAFERKVFIEIGGYVENSAYASGDDMFLMEGIHRKHRRGVQFLKNKDAIVYTEPAGNIHDFLSQRKRWVSKAKGYKSLRIILVALIVYLFNLSLLGLFLACIIVQFFSLWSVVCGLWTVFICLFIAKSLIDFPVMSGIIRFMGRRSLLKLFIPLEFINMIYVTVIGIAGTFTAYRWKNRKINQY